MCLYICDIERIKVLLFVLSIEKLLNVFGFVLMVFWKICICIRMVVFVKYWLESWDCDIYKLYICVLNL